MGKGALLNAISTNMSLVENTLFGTVDKVQVAIDRLKAFEPVDGYFIAYSGGKDSEVILDLVKRSGCKFDAHFSVTSVEAPETIYFIRKEHPEVIWEFPKDKDGKVKTMWNLIPKRMMPPTGLARYCCAELKECAGEGRLTVTGTRWAESPNRKRNQGKVTVMSVGKKIKEELLENENFMQTNRGGVILNNDNEESRKMVEHCYRKTKTVLNPIIDWSDDEVWEYIKTRGLKVNPLYDKGKRRVGCIGCPMNVRAEEEFKEYPKIKQLYLRAFDEMIKRIKARGYECIWKDADDVMEWWLKGKEYPSKIQTGLFDED